MNPRTVLILGGYGAFGRHITQSLADEPTARVVIAGRQASKGAEAARDLSVEFRQCDACDENSLREAIEDAWLVVNASGPFHANDYSIPQACIRAKRHYIDLADGREYVANAVALNDDAERQSVGVCVGASTTPAITSAMVERLQGKLGQLRSIRVALNAGNKNHAGVSTIATILSYTGCPMTIWRDGEWRDVRGWSGGEFVAFPSPVGRRRVQYCDVPDLQLFPKRFQVREVTFKAGVELTVLNYAIAAMAWLKRACPPIHLPSLARPMVSMSKLFKPFGTLHGGCAVWATNNKGQTGALALVANKNGPRIPGSPAILLARKWLRDGQVTIGAYPCMDLLELDEFVQFLRPFDIFLAEGDGQEWHAVDKS